MKNTIAARIADFLQEFPPFDLIDNAQLLSISAEVKVIYLEKGKHIFKKGEKGHSQFYVVNKGAVALQKEENGQVKPSMNAMKETFLACGRSLLRRITC